MELQCKIRTIFPAKTRKNGVGKEVKSQEVLVQYMDGGRWLRQLLLHFGESKLHLLNDRAPGDEVNIRYNLDSYPYKSGYYTRIFCYEMWLADREPGRSLEEEWDEESKY